MTDNKNISELNKNMGSESRYLAAKVSCDACNRCHSPNPSVITTISNVDESIEKSDSLVSYFDYSDPYESLCCSCYDELTYDDV